MPELPEVEIVCRGLAPAVKGARIVKLEQNRANLRVPFPDNFPERVLGAVINDVKRRAKYVFIELDSKEVMIIHLGMSGVLKIIPNGEVYECVKHDHMVIHLDNGVRVILNDPRRFGMVLLIAASDIERHKSFSSLGPEPFGNGFNAEYLYLELQKRKSPIKGALLDQSLVAGLGNIYVCEALYKCLISPLRVSNKVTMDECENLVFFVREILQKAIEAGGSTLKDYRHTDGKLGYFQHQFTVYGRENEKCPDCNCESAIKRISQSGRSSFYCEERQV